MQVTGESKLLVSSRPAAGPDRIFFLPMAAFNFQSLDGSQSVHNPVLMHSFTESRLFSVLVAVHATDLAISMIELS
jgi:hypothetical protein